MRQLDEFLSRVPVDEDPRDAFSRVAATSDQRR